MEKVVKRTFGYGKPKENENYTHVILTEDEHNNKNAKIRDLQSNIEKLERDYKAEIEKYKRIADNKIKEIQAEADKRVAEAKAETEEHKNKADSFENINKNLIRIATERANAKRGLTPKKQHSSYVFLNIEEFAFNCECSVENSKKTTVLKLPCFKVRLQSPYDVAFELKAVKDLIYGDIINKIGNKMGFDSTFKNGINGYSENEIRKLWNDERNFMFRLIYKANFLKDFWEVEFLGRDMPVIPPDMTAKK